MRSIYISIAFICIVFTQIGNAQPEITLEGIWKNDEFATNTLTDLKFLNDGVHYIQIEDSKIEKYDIRTGNKVQTIFNGKAFAGVSGFSGDISDYAFSEDESKLLLTSESEKIYRRSTKADYYVFNLESRDFRKIFDEGKISFATFSPNAEKVAFVYQNNLYYNDLDDKEVIQITRDGKYNEIINGAADWVYEEEFSIARAFQWSADSEKIAFMRFDESEVKEFIMANHTNDLYPEFVKFKYPKVGEKNAELGILIYNVKNKRTIKAELGDLVDMYVPRIKWTNDKNTLCVSKMNRHQNHLQLLLVDAENGASRLMFEEKNKYYIDITDDLTFLKEEDQFIWSSEKSGYNHLYLYDMEGKRLRQLTEGEFDVTEFYGIDEENGFLYYQTANVSPMHRNVYQLNIMTGEKKLMTDSLGYNSLQFSSSYAYYIWNQTSINSPPSFTVYDKSGGLIRTIEDNSGLKSKQKVYGVQPVEFFEFTTTEDVQLNGYMIKPANFKENRRYPVFMYLYGGPGSQKVVDSWQGSNYWWFQMLAKQGYLIACVDNRGTGARGEEFKKMTYLKLGHYETIDQIEAAKYLAALPYTDPTRVGIFGWSYGGFMSSSCILKGNDVFKAAIAVAPVTSWRWYDTIYTERFMRTEEENPDGFQDNSPINFAERLKGNYLLIHGMSDDNVHFQHTAEMASALIEANKQFDTYFYPNQSHSINKGLAKLHLYTKMTNFLFKKL